MSKAAELAALISSQSALSDRNLVINGAMQVAQRGTSATVTTGTGPQTCDRFFVEAASSGTFSITQSTTSPDGFANSLKFDCTTADASPNYLLFGYRFEGQDVQNLKKGTSGALSTTLSFYVRSSKTGTYQVNLRDIDNGRIIGATYTISSADTWELKTVTFAGDTSGTLGNDTGNSLTIEWWLAAGSTYNSGAVPTAWEATANGDRAAGLSVAIGASTDDDFHITGVQLEVGEQATPFEHRSFADELARCQRYFQKNNVANFTLNVVRQSDNLKRGTLTYPPMRDDPTYTSIDGSGDGATINVQDTQPEGLQLRMSGGSDTNVPLVKIYTVEAEL